MAASGDYVVLADESLRVLIPHWLELFQTHIESSPYQFLGLSGYEQIVQQDNIAQSAARVVTHIASKSGVSGAGYSANRFFGEAHAKEVVLIDGRCLFARKELFQSFPFQPTYTDSLSQTLIQYQIQFAVEKGQAQGVLLGIPHEIDEDSPWNDNAVLSQCWDGRYQHILPLDVAQLSIWRLNLKALQNFDEAAAQQLLYLLSKADGYRFQYRDHNRVSAVKGDQLALVVDHFNEVESLPEGDTFVVCGAGTGMLIQQLLDQQHNEVLVVEPEYGLICELLKFYDWSDALSNGRLRFFPLVGGTVEVQDITLLQTTRLLQVVLDKNHRTTHVIRGYSYHLNSPWFRRLEQGLVQYLNQRQFADSWLPQRRQVYDVTVVSPKCAIFANLAQCFNDLGLKTRLFNVPDKSDQLTVDQTRQLLTQLAVDGSRLTLCRNRSFFETENVRKAASLERYIQGNLVNWWWDIPNVASFVDFNDPLNEAENIGFAVDILNVLPKGAHWLPPAAGVQFCRERPKNMPWRFPISFVGQSRISLLENNISAILRFIESQCGAVPLYIESGLVRSANFCELHQSLCDLQQDFVAMTEAMAVVAPAHVYFFKYIYDMAKTAAFRVAAIETLFRHQLPVAVFGDDSWVTRGVVPESHFYGPIARKDLPELYQSSKINLNLNFMQVSSTVNPKVFDILACDSAVISDYRPEIEVLFPDPECRPLCFSSLDELVPLVENALGINQLDRWQLSGQEVRRKHTLAHRAQWFIDAYLQNPT